MGRDEEVVAGCGGRDGLGGIEGLKVKAPMEGRVFCFLFFLFFVLDKNLIKDSIIR